MKYYDAARARCPYFESCTGKKIYCEGAADGMRAVHAFGTAAERERHMQENCEHTAPGTCRYRLLLDELYERGLCR